MKQTVYEREFVTGVGPAKFTGFKPRSVQNLATVKKPRTMLDVECAHILRNSFSERGNELPTLQYMMWLEAGREDNFPKPDPHYNSNLWRNFTRKYGLESSPSPPPQQSKSPRRTKQQKHNILDNIAQMYPLILPKPSQIGEHTYGKFLTDVPTLISDERLRRLIIRNSEDEIREFKLMKLRAEARVPPLSKRGDILPPRSYRKHEARVFRTPSPVSDKEPAFIDLFGQKVPKDMFKPWVSPGKLIFRKNTPHYGHVKAMMSEHTSSTRTKERPGAVTTTPRPQSETFNHYTYMDWKNLTSSDQKF